jgi:hypothetical protein
MCTQTYRLTSFARKCGQKMMFETNLTPENIQFVARANRERIRTRSDAGSSGATTVDAILDSLRLSARIGWSSMDEQKRERRATASLFHDSGWRDSVSLAARVGGIFAQAGVHPRVATGSDPLQPFHIRRVRPFVSRETIPTWSHSTSGATLSSCTLS